MTPPNPLIGPESLVRICFLDTVDVGGPPPPKGSGTRYFAGGSDWLAFGKVDLAIERGQAVIMPPTEKRTIKLRIDMSSLSEPLRSHSGVNTSAGSLLHGDECQLPAQEALYLFGTGRAMPLGDSPIDRWYGLLSERKRRGPTGSAPKTT